MKAWDADKTLNGLKDSLRTAQKAKDKSKEIFIKGCQMVMQSIPTIDVAKVIVCGECAFCNKEKHRCTHRNGLIGRIKPDMYCSYGSYDYSLVDDCDEDDFSEFEEDING